MLSQVSPLPLIFVFLFSPLKILSFSRSPPILSQKNDDLGFIYRWIIMKVWKHVCNPIPNIPTVGNLKIMSDFRGRPFAL